MRVPVEWLADYVAVELPTEELADGLTMAGLKIEAIERLGGGWDDVIIGQVVELERHPSPKLKKPMNVAQVETGSGATLTVVTGAQNVSLGDKVALVPVGGLLPHGPEDRPMIIQARPMFGITSQGMLASERELGISDEHSGILVLPPNAPVGRPLRSFMGGDVLDIETNPNRPDTLSIIGITREVAAITQQQLTLPDLDRIEGVQWLDEESIPVTVEAPDLCPRYSALRIEGVRVGPAPQWMQARLEAAGMRPINLIVDSTNYVMLEYGQPMHAFDASCLRGGEIVVRRAREGEQVRTLDGVDRSLTPHDLVIADLDRAVAVAGVMGGEDSEISDDTTTIILESANFEPSGVRRTAQALGLRTESSSRFEKGLPAEQTTLGIRRFLQLLAQVSEGEPRAARVTDVWVGEAPAPTVVMPLRDLDRLLGIVVPPEIAAEKLSLLGFDVTVGTGAIEAVVPYWRRTDVERPADLVEEVARLVGYDAIPATLPRRTMEPPPLPADLQWEDMVRTRLLSAGLSEATTHSLTSRAALDRLILGGDHTVAGTARWASLVPNAAGVYEREALVEPVRLLNPATNERQVLRMSLLPGLLGVVAHNLKVTKERIAFFEIDRTYFARAEVLPYERRTLALALAGLREPRTWRNPKPDQYSFYEVKGVVEALLGTLQVAGWCVEPAVHPALHPGRSAVLRLAGHEVAYFGELHPDVAERFEIEGWRTQVAEVDLDALLSHASDRHVFSPLPRYPSARRDVAVVVDLDTPADEIVRCVREAAGDVLERAEIFDVYRGEPLGPDRKSIAIAMELRAPGSTLTQEEVAEVMARVLDQLETQLGATLRE